MEKESSNETGSAPAAPSAPAGVLNLRQAIDFGEYDPKYLANFAEWHNLSRHIQFELIRKALDIRHKQLISQYAELSSALDFSKKPNVQQAMRNLEQQLRDLRDDSERLYIEYSK